MRLPATQNLSDEQLFYIIENGIRLTGMPGWGTGTKAGEDDSWRLVHVIRRLPTLSPEEIAQMEARNPRTPEEVREVIVEEQFLRGDDPAPSPEANEPSHAHE